MEVLTLRMKDKNKEYRFYSNKSSWIILNNCGRIDIVDKGCEGQTLHIPFTSLEYFTTYAYEENSRLAQAMDGMNDMTADNMPDYVVVQYLNHILHQYTNEYEIGDSYDLFTPEDKTAVERAIQIIEESMRKEG